ncbi:MAG: mechanosensitive ion channel family protein [Candidatus Omnitrophota bacterium]
MMETLKHLSFNNMIVVVEPLTAFVISFAVGLIIRKIIISKLTHLAKNTETEIDDIIMHGISRPFVIWCAMFAIYMALNVSKIPAYWVDISGKTLLILGILSVTLVLANITSGLIRSYSGNIGKALPATTLTQNVARIIIIGIGFLIILNALGISITPILATLGVGGLAVALALQETLSNLFAGFYVIMARQVKVGDYIRLESGQEGYVTDIDWRITKIRMLPNNVVLVPNSKLTQSIITNYNLPDKSIAFSVELSVHYNTDLAKAEHAAIEAAKDTMKNVTGGIPEYEPAVRYKEFGDSGITLVVNLMAREFTGQFLIKHEFIKRLTERFRKEGIVIPYPIRAINYSQEKAQ